jgi:glycosyltransferase involved in cell wall biosynthesis
VLIGVAALPPRRQDRTPTRSRRKQLSRELAVLMTAYNAERTIRRALDSLGRNSELFDLLIVDDCSRRPLAEFLGPLGDGVEIVRPNRNLGVAGAKNFGLKRLLAQPYEFVAMMDADDISHPERLAKQMAFLKAHPDIALVGAWARFFDENTHEEVYQFRPPCSSRDIRNALFFNSYIMHPTWMVRSQALRDAGPYSNAYPAAEDYELLRRMSKTSEFANLPEFLLEYSISMSGISMNNRRRQLFDRLRIQGKYFEPWQARAWLGVARTLAMFAVPRTVLSAYRRNRTRVQQLLQLNADLAEADSSVKQRHGKLEAARRRLTLLRGAARPMQPG